MNINATVEKLPGMSETIFGDPDYGLVSIDTDGTDADSIKLQLLFYYVREGLNSDRWIKIKEAARLLAARTMVMTLKKIIPPADTPPYDCRDTCQERIKLLEGNEFIFELEWWKKTLANPDEQDTVTIDFKMVNNTRVPLSKIGDTYVYKLKF
jgi:hypothetical protein